MSQPWTKIVLCIFQVCHVCSNFLWFVNWVQDLSLLEWSLLIIIFKWNWIWREGHVISAENQGEESYADQKFFHIVVGQILWNSKSVSTLKHIEQNRFWAAVPTNVHVTKMGEINWGWEASRDPKGIGIWHSKARTIEGVNIAHILLEFWTNPKKLEPKIWSYS